MSNPSALIDYIVRVKLPSSSDYLSCPSGDVAYERDYNDTIFAAKPEGFEVDWATKNSWPVDKDGKTWVLLYCTDHKKAVEYFNDRIVLLENKILKFREIAEFMNKI